MYNDLSSDLPENMIVADTKERTDSKQIAYNLKKIKFIPKTNKEYFEESYKKITIQFGKEPTKKIYAMTDTGETLFILYLEKKIVFPYAFSVTNDTYKFFRFISQ